MAKLSKLVQSSIVAQVHRLAARLIVHENGTRDRPIRHVVPQDFCWHDDRIAEHPILVLVSLCGAVVEPLENFVVRKRSHTDSSPRQISVNQVGQQSISKRDEVATG